MKKALTVFCCVLLSVALLGCSQKTTKSLPQSISQNDWNSAREYVDLPTGVKMSYVEMGNADGPVVILQHGTCDNSRVWSLSAPYFCDAGYHVYIPDLRGQGYSSQPDGYYTVNDYANDLRAFMDIKGIDKACMVGHSLGSFTMQTFAIMFPERCEQVVLVGSGVLNTSMHNTSILDYFKSLSDAQQVPDEFMDNWYKIDNYVPEDFLSYVKQEAKRLPANVWVNVFGGFSITTLEDVYYTYDASIPTLILHGTKDTMLTDEHQKRLMSYLPFATYKEYEGIGHNIQYEIPEQLANDIISWIQAN